MCVFSFFFLKSQHCWLFKCLAKTVCLVSYYCHNKVCVLRGISVNYFFLAVVQLLESQACCWWGLLRPFGDIPTETPLKLGRLSEEGSLAATCFYLHCIKSNICASVHGKLVLYTKRRETSFGKLMVSSYFLNNCGMISNWKKPI